MMKVTKTLKNKKVSLAFVLAILLLTAVITAVVVKFVKFGVKKQDEREEFKNKRLQTLGIIIGVIVAFAIVAMIVFSYLTAEKF